MTTKKTILILKPQANSLADTERFLKNRDWRVQHTCDPKEAIKLLLETHPQFFLLCLDHNNPMVKKIPLLVANSYSGCLILCAETASASMTDTILNAKSDYKILPPITGPAIERLSHKFIKDLKEKFDEHARFQKEIEQRPPPAKLNSINIVKGSAAETKLPSQKGKSNDLKHSLHEAGEESQASNLNRRKDTKKLKNSWVQVEESLIIKGAVDALQNSLNVTTVNPNDLIDVVSNLACITIESPKFSGYLITAMGKNKKIDGKFVKKIQQRLIKFLKESGEEISEDQNMDLEIKQVPFEDWALEYAEFMRKSVHNGSEVAMAFFPRKDIKTILETSYDEKMAALKIDEIQGNSTVNFNLYIRLPRNNKYVLYTPRGGIFYEDQKGRLESRGVSDLHIMKEDLEKIDKYRAEKFLNEKIQEFEENERQNGPPIKQKKAV